MSLQNLKQTAIKIVALSALSLLVAPRVNAQSWGSQPSVVKPSRECVCDPNDPFDPRAKMPKGFFKGKCLSCQQRSVKLLTSAEAAPYKPSPGMTVFANFNHKGKFWVAKIPQDAVEDVIFQIQYFNILPSPYSAHGQIRFRLKPGYEAILMPQPRNQVPTEIRLRDFVYSANAIWVRSGVWDPVTGLIDFYAVAHEMIALEDKIQDALKYPFTDRIEPIRLALTPKQKQQLLLNAISQGERDRTNLMYDTLKRNCTTESLRVIDSTIQYSAHLKQQYQPEIFLNMPTGPAVNEALLQGNLNPQKLTELLTEKPSKLSAFPLPTAPFTAIERRKLIKNYSKMPNLEDEFSLPFRNKNR